MVRVGIGQDSHRFEPPGSPKPLILAGVRIPGCEGLEGNSDADVVLHALANAVSGISGVNVIGPTSDRMCREGITDSKAYVAEALRTLHPYRLTHISIAIECGRPRLVSHLETMRRAVADICGLAPAQVGITVTSGEGLTAFGRGEGIQAFVIATALIEERAKTA